jgi:hypothetical protein
MILLMYMRHCLYTKCGIYVHGYFVNLDVEPHCSADQKLVLSFLFIPGTRI